MKKIPTLFVRDPEDRKHVLNEVTPGCEWVLADEGTATRKYDGTCCLVYCGDLWKRHEVKPGKMAPAGFEAISTDENTGKTVGWVPVGDGPEDQWHREAFAHSAYWPDGTYELLGPKVQGNPEGVEVHVLQPHDRAEAFLDLPLHFGGLRDWLLAREYEGIVWHHPDGRMAKLKKRDFA